MFCNVSLKLNMVNRNSALGPETEQKFALTCSFQKVIRTLASRGHKKFDNSFHFKIPGIV